MGKGQEADSTVASASAAAREVLQTTMEELRRAALSGGEGEPRGFFPNGIELISVKVKVATVEVELKVAGAAGALGFLPGVDEEIDAGEAGGDGREV